MDTDTYHEFRQAADRSEAQIDFGRAALTIALPDYPDLDIADYLRRVDGLGAEVIERCGADADGFRSIAALNFVLFSRHRFRGNRDDYYDPKNSFLNEVIERKTGIPITLSVLYMEVAERIGLRLDGVGFPGHFLVKTVFDGNEIVIDPFDGGPHFHARTDDITLVRGTRTVRVAAEASGAGAPGRGAGVNRCPDMSSPSGIAARAGNASSIGSGDSLFQIVSDARRRRSGGSPGSARR